MVSSVSVLWLVAGLLGGAFSLSCFHCNTTGKGSCEENEKSCVGEQDVCLTTITEIRPDKRQPKSMRYLVKSCGEKKFCNQTYSMSFNSTSLYATIQCCNSNKCKAPEPELPKALSPENQLKCPACNEPSVKCSSPISISCLGEENMCISYTSKEAAATGPAQAWQGCATENVCTMQNVSTLPMNHILDTKFQCNHAPPLLSVLLLPVTFGLAMTKLLL